MATPTMRDRLIDLGFIKYYPTTIDESEKATKRVMKEETGLLVNKERNIFNILAVATVLSVIITVNYARN